MSLEFTFHDHIDTVVRGEWAYECREYENGMLGYRGTNAHPIKNKML